MNKPILIKLGGSVLHNERSTHALCQDIQKMVHYGYPIVLVHGGGLAIREALNTYGIASEFIHGLRKTTADAMKIIEMVLCGQINQHLVRHLNRGIGLSGATNHTLICSPISQELGFVGQVVEVNTSFIEHLLIAKFIPVVASLGVDMKGNALNLNADLAASALAHALRAQKLIYLTDQEGIYNENGTLLDTLSEENLRSLMKESIVKDGMLVKVKAVLHAMKQGLNHILIANGHQQNILTDALISEKKVGTLCLK